MTEQSLLHGAAVGGPAETNRATMARVAAALWAGGGLLLLLALALADREDIDRTIAIATAAVAAAMFAAFQLGRERLPGWFFHVGSAASTIAVAAALYGHDGLDAGIELFFIWIVLYAFYFYPWVPAALHAALVGTAYAAALVLGDGDGGAAEWALTVGALVTAGVIVGLLRDRVNGLVGRLQQAAVTDALTGLLNRRGFDDRIDREVERARRHGRGLALLVGDLDRFKALNDAFGHLAGDTALERVAGLMEDAVRRVDTTARLGGEEFAIIVPEGDEQSGFQLAERLRQELERTFAGDVVKLTISFGVAAFPRDGSTADELLLAADRALYLAKALGRNRTAIHTEETATLLARLLEPGEGGG